MTIFDRMHLSHMAQIQNRFDFPPAPKLNANGRLDQSRARKSGVA